MDPHRVSTGVAPLDDALGGLFWGDNVVWELEEGGQVEPFVTALLRRHEQFGRVILVRLDGDVDALRVAHPGADIVDARPGSAFADPARLMAAVRERAGVPRALVVFDSLDALGARWGETAMQRFFMRTCPMLLDLWAIAYWSVTPSHLSAAGRYSIDATTQCVLVLGGDRLRVAKAEGRPPGVQGRVFRLQPNGSQVEIEGAPTAARLGAALRAIRIQRHLSQGDLADLAGVSASAISQAERGRRGLALDTLLHLTSRLNMTIDELLRGEIARGYRLARCPPPEQRIDRMLPLFDDPHAGLRVRLSHLSPGQSVRLDNGHDDIELIAVASGLVQVTLSTGGPVLRKGETLLVETSVIVGWRNIGHENALLFWILRDQPGPSRPTPATLADDPAWSNGDAESVRRS